MSLRFSIRRMVKDALSIGLQVNSDTSADDRVLCLRRQAQGWLTYQTQTEVGRKARIFG